ncbi:glucose-1-phosphate cytidylyltransferase [Gluconacetobacter azotocaptans]|uniref:Glucose-1-phosphate cytidylyltransferase n=1 Tax=Gluconacetobacter azotocaptans TaxID=142834 RepID=A0A7W4JPU7_9PROT|nr:glucose-1-phosphate cytidylyltransferase [Gluconacetobacter azotocaptans]MBB2188706.1 glucose-1-phosphate cytidylyltransferase [Gluconacetobacter azotocaptans]
MKAVILAGGLGTRLAEETATKPKPMVEIGGKPILWHIMKIYSAHGINDFVVCLGYKGHVIKEYFLKYFQYMSDVTVDLKNNTIETHFAKAEPWRITLVDTGELTMTGGRLKRVLPYVENDPYFCMTYGDGVGNVDITRLIDFHKSHGLAATVTGTQPPGRFGALKLDNERVVSFLEKPVGDGNWINGGFFVLSPKVGERIAGDDTTWEQEPLETLARDGQLGLFRHSGFWQPMDSLRDKVHLEKLWDSGEAPWKIW